METYNRGAGESKVANYVPEPAENRSVMEILAALSKSNPTAYEEAIEKLITEKGHDWFKNLRYDWSINGRPKQFPPMPLEKWRAWVCLAGRGWGKMEPLSNQLLTANRSWITLGELEVGDYLFDEQGQPTRVTHLHPIQIPERAYRITFDDGTTVDCGGEHMFVTFNAQERKALNRSQYVASGQFPYDWVNWESKMDRSRKSMRVSHALKDEIFALHEQGTPIRGIVRETGVSRNVVRNYLRGITKENPALTTTEVRPKRRDTDELYLTQKYGKRGDNNHSIPTCFALEYPKVVLPSLHPYILGCYIGDGTRGSGTFTQHPDDAVHLRAKFESLGLKTTTVGAKNAFGTKGLLPLLREAGVCERKHIPRIYLQGTLDERLELLRGLMDTDGTIARDASYCEFSQSNEEIAYQVYELIVSLGMKCSITSRTPKNSFTGLNGKRNWRLRFTPTFQVFSLPRKMSRYRENKTQLLRHKQRMIVKVEPITPVPMRCITVDSPNSLYLTGKSLVPTSNTKTGGNTVDMWVNLHKKGTPPLRIALVGATTSDVNNVMVGGDSGIMSNYPPESAPEWHTTNRKIFWKYPDGEVKAIAELFSAEEPDRLRGPQFHYAWCLVGDTPVLMGDGTTKPLKDVKRGEYVQTRDGSKEVLESYLTKKNAELYELLLLDGRVIIGTGEHPVYISNTGFVQLQNIKEGDFVLCANPVSNSMEEFITLEETLHIIKHLLNYIERCGDITMEKFQKDTISIIKTRIEQITQLKIWSAYLGRNTQKFTELNDLQNIESWLLQIQKNLENAIEQNYSKEYYSVNYVEKSIAVGQRTQDSYAHKSVWMNSEITHTPQNQDYVLFAEKNTKHQRMLKNTAPDNATIEHMQKEPLNWLNEQLNVLFAKLNLIQNESTHDFVAENALRLCDTQVISVKKLAKKSDVYDLTIEGSHEFFANGILVHNCDELAAWRYQEAWDMLMFGLRLGDNPQVVVTTTPRPYPILLDLLKLKTTYTTIGSTYENRSNLAPAFFTEIITKYEGSTLGRQELMAEIIEEVPNAMWNYENLEKNRISYDQMERLPEFLSVILAIDPATSTRTSSAETGMCVAAYGEDDHFYILHLDSVKMTPEQWARRAIKLFEQYSCDKMIAEVNNGGDLVEAVIKAANPLQKVYAVHASRGKTTRAEPIAALYEQNRVHHIGKFPRAEEQMCVVGDTNVSAYAAHQIATRLFTGKLVTIKTLDSSLTLTYNHPVYTQRGWVKAENLTTKDVLYYAGKELQSIRIEDAYKQSQRENTSRTFNTDGETFTIHTLQNAGAWANNKRVGNFRPPSNETMQFNSNRVGISSGDYRWGRNSLFYKSKNWLSKTYDKLLQHKQRGDSLGEKFASLQGRYFSGGENIFETDPCVAFNSSGFGISSFVQSTYSIFDNQEEAYAFVDSVDRGQNTIESKRNLQRLHFKTKSNFRSIQDYECSPITEIRTEEVRDLPVYNLSTSTEWYVANGFITHNCAFNPIENPYGLKDMVDALVWAMTWLVDTTQGRNTYKPIVGGFRTKVQEFRDTFKF